MKYIRQLALLAATVTLAACPKRPAPLGPRPTPVIKDDSLERARADSIARADSLRRIAEEQARARADSLRAARDREQQLASQNANTDSVLRATIYFAYDQSELTEVAKALLNAKVPVLQARSEIRIRITGHTDARGASEYNLALGLRRASETKAYLVAAGINASRIDIFSLGAERPAVEGSGEEVWSKNRRAEFQVLNGRDD